MAAIEVLGLKDCLVTLFSNIGWRSILEISAPTYRRITLEILSTLEVSTFNRSVPESAKFRVLNQEYTLTTDQINGFFRVPNCGDFNKTGGFNASHFWPYLVDTDFFRWSSGDCKASMIRNPIFRLIQRIIAHTVLARKDNSSMRETELLILYCMLNRIELNFVQIFLQQSRRQAAAKAGIICLGGLWTHIIQHMGIDLSEQEAEPYELITLERLQDICFIKKIMGNSLTLFVIKKFGHPMRRRKKMKRRPPMRLTRLAILRRLTRLTILRST